MNLIFGDFISAYNLITGLMYGEVMHDVFDPGGILSGGGFGYGDTLALFMTILFDLATVFLIIYIISFRSI